MISKKIYIAGPMTGFPNYNWDVFDAKEQQLSKEGWIVVNPAQMDREANIDPSREMKDYDYEECASRDIAALQTCDAIYMLSGWQHSKGACWERALAKHWNLRRFYEIPRLNDI